uniref:adenosylcobinamide-phosphate synthase CbiB n=1 Tax=Comamonas composti TaxID=408558 RepID=UPI001FE1A942|nr:adenosylcobinamide-phosphate synthase CbiB [Comamonas composti]
MFLPWGPEALALAVVLALAMDALWGEPPAFLHPVVAMGRVLQALGQRVAPADPEAVQRRDYKSFWLAALAWCALAAIVSGVYGLLQALLASRPWWLQALVMAVLLKPLFAWRMLKHEVLAVEAALQQGLSQGRERLRWLVSRDTAALDAAEVRESAIETLAENLNDSVVAPLFWFAVAGLPGAALYRLANTADAMWGYPGWRGQGAQRRYWQWAGKWTARADDVLSWIPARITALLLLVVAPGAKWQGLRRDAHSTPSPNGGWPMGAMARILGVRLGKPGVYVLNPGGCVPQSLQLQQAVGHASRVVRLLGCVALALVLVSGLVIPLAARF